MKNVSPRFFLDTNILAYAYDAKEAAKRDRAMLVVEAADSAGTAAISTQVLSELYATLTRPRNINLPFQVAEATIQRYIESWVIFEITPVHVLEAMRAVRQHRLSYYDALIWATARLNGVPYILSEDGQDGMMIEGVRLINPLAPDFDLELLS